MPSSTSSWPRRIGGTDAVPRAASPRNRSACVEGSQRQLIRRGQYRKLSVRRSGVGGKPAQERVHGGGLPVQLQAGPVVGQQAGGRRPVSRRLGVPDRFHRISMVGVPLRSPAVQRGDLTRCGPAQLQPQQVREQLVVPEPRARHVQRHHERVRILQLLQGLLAAVVSGQQVGELAIDLFQDRGSQQEPPYPFAQPLQYLGQQVLGDGPFAAGELGREPFRVRVPGQRQRRQPQPRRPPLRPLIQHPQRRLGQLHSRRGEQLPGLSQAEPQVRRADLGELPLQPQPVQPQPQIMPGRQHEAQPRRATHQQQLKLPPRFRRSKLVHVIEHQPEPVLERRQVLQQPLHHRPPVQVRRRRQLPDQPRPGSGLAQCAQHRQPEPLRITIVTPDRYPPVLSFRPVSPIHDRSSTDFPLPGGAETTVTRADAPSRPNSPVRDTTPSRTRTSGPPATASGSPTGPMTQILARHQPALAARHAGTAWPLTTLRPGEILRPFAA